MIDESIFAEKPLPQGMSVLIVEPDRQMAVFYQYLLQSQQYVAVPVTSVEDAMAALATDPQRYVGAVVDIDNAEAIGWEFVKQLRLDKDCGELPVLVIAELIGTRTVFAQMRQLCDAIILKGDFEIPRFHEQLTGIIRDRMGAGSGENSFFNAETRFM